VQCVILAGGLGTRMWPEAQRVPKTLLPVDGRPFADLQLRWLRDGGIDSVVYCIGHLGDQVRDFAGDGGRWSLSIGYADEGSKLRGTAGALRTALDADLLADDFLVLYGDSWLQVHPGEVLAAVRSSSRPALMTVFRNDGHWDRSNVVFDGERVVRYTKGLADPPPEMCWIDYGLLALRRAVIVDRVPPGEVSDLAPLLSDLAAEDLLAGHPVAERFYEIGSVAGRAELEAHLAAPVVGGSP